MKSLEGLAGTEDDVSQFLCKEFFLLFPLQSSMSQPRIRIIFQSWNISMRNL